MPLYAVVLAVFWYALTFGLFLLPGVVIAAWLVQRRHWDMSVATIPAIVASCAIGYVVFWAYFAHPTAGRAVSVSAMIGAVACLGWPSALQRDIVRTAKHADLAQPLAIMFLAGLCYLGMLYGVDFAQPPQWRAVFRFPHLDVASDNLISMVFSERLYAGQDARPFMGDWHSSDRPPLQTGLVLVQRPFADWGMPALLQYQILGTIAQCCWIPAVWALARRAGLDGRRVALGLSFLLLSGFVLFNAIFVWPKLLAGALTLSLVTLLLLRPPGRARPSALEAATAGGAAAFGLLAHGSAFFTILAVAVLMLHPRFSPGLARSAVAIVAFVVLLTPWLAYQRWYDPPGNRLVKWHLAGVVPVDDRSLGTALVDSYTAAGVAGTLANKWDNVKALAGQPWIAPATPAPDALGNWRVGEYSNVLKTLGVLNLGWLALLAPFRGSNPSPLPPAIRTVLLVALVSVLAWLLLMFGPGTTLNHQNSYATTLLLVAGLSALIGCWPTWACGTLLVLQAVDFTLVWLIARPADAAANGPVLGVATAAFVGLAVCLYRLGRERHTAVR